MTVLRDHLEEVHGDLWSVDHRLRITGLEWVPYAHTQKATCKRCWNQLFSLLQSPYFIRVKYERNFYLNSPNPVKRMDAKTANDISSVERQTKVHAESVL